jgi:hypothetical protein
VGTSDISEWCVDIDVILDEQKVLAIVLFSSMFVEGKGLSKNCRGRLLLGSCGNPAGYIGLSVTASTRFNPTISD